MQETVAEATKRKYAQYVNPGLAKLLDFAGYGVEMEAEGCYITDDAGKRYLDCLGGYGVFSPGHRHPKVVEAAKKALDTMPLSSKVFFSKQYADLAEKLASIAPGDLQFTFMCNSGTEAVEGALKMAKVYDHRPKVVSTVGGYHGKSMGALSATGKDNYREPFYPLIPEFCHVRYNDVDAMRSSVDDHTAAVIVETVQGEGGIHVPDAGYLPAVREICDAHGALLILDEVQTGFGRTGKMFGAEHTGVVPDIMTLAKGLSGGVVPVGAVMGTAAVWERAFGENPLLHTSTFGGNPLACSVALAAIEVIEEEGLAENSRVVGEHLIARLREVGAHFPAVFSEVRGVGLMIGVEFSMDDVAELTIAAMVKRNVVAAYTLNNPRVIRFEPPLIMTKEQADTAVDVFADAVAETEQLLAAVMGS
ncbi:MAG: aspartate aminotransferase family protein [Fimbriimonadales bacterium]